MTATATRTPPATPAPPPVAPRRRPGLSAAGWAVVAAIAILLIGRLVLAGQYTLALGRSDSTAVHRTLIDARDWVEDNRNINGFFIYFLNYLQIAFDSVGSFVTEMISRTSTGLRIPQIGWLGLVAVATWLAFAVGNVRMALLTFGVFMFIGLQGLWPDATFTLSLVISAVFFSLLVGIPLGVWAGTSDRFNKLITPVLDFMQILPSFAYLAPLVLVFGIGVPAAIAATIIYSAPPVIRITAHGIRQVPLTTREAVDSMGVTGFQRLRTVLIPMARRTIVIGVSQTVMAALSMVTIAALIGAPGLGLKVAQALQSLDVGTAFNAGLAIVLMAILFDRVTTAASVRAELALRAGGKHVQLRRLSLGISFAVAAVLVYLSRTQLWAAKIPDDFPDIGRTLSTAASDVSEWAGTHLSVITLGFKDWFSNTILNPFQDLLTGSPFFVVIVALVLIAWAAGGWKVGLTVLVALGLQVLLGLWSDSMATLAATLVATALVMIISIPVGVWMGRSKKVDRIVRPVLDAGQTMPPFVYLVPFLGLFGSSRFTAISAAIVYAAPAAIKIIADGISQVSPTTVEAAMSSGSTRWQMITRVQIPMARSSIALAANQGLIYVLSMVVVGGLVGAGALGYDVYAGLNQRELFGKGLAAGFTLVVMGIVIDRITQAAARKSTRRDVVVRPDRTAPALPAAPAAT